MTNPRPTSSAVAVRPTRSGLTRLPDANTAPALDTAAADHLVTRGGQLHRTYRKVELRLARKEIYTLSKGQTWEITADGYRALNVAAGMQMILAPTVPVDGIDQRNPHIARDLRGKIVEVFVRGALVGRSGNGNVLILTQTIHYSPDLYFARDLFNAVRMKQHWDKQGGGYVDDTEWKDAGRIVGLEKFDRASLGDDEALYELDDKVGVVVDLKSLEVNDVLATRNENHIFAVRKALTILESRLCKAHPGLPRQHIPGDQVKVIEEEREGWKGKKKTVIVDAIAVLPVLGWIESAGAQRELLVAAGRVQDGHEEGLEEKVIDLAPASAGSVDPEKVEPTAVAATPPADVLEDGTADAKEHAAAAETNEPPAETEPPKDETPPFPAETIELEKETREVLERLRKLKGGSRKAADLVGALLDQDTELIAHEPERIRGLKAAAEAAIAEIEDAKAKVSTSPPPAVKPRQVHPGTGRPPTGQLFASPTPEPTDDIDFH